VPIICNQQVVRSTRIAGSIQNQLLTAIITRRLIILGCVWDGHWWSVQPINRRDWRQGSGWWVEFRSDSVKLRFISSGFRKNRF
jgi:hypothetical protein